MNGFKKWFMNRVIKSEVTQGYSHVKNIESLYLIIRAACESEFTEDNAVTMDAFLRERFEATQYTPTQVGEDYNDAVHAAYLKGVEALAGYKEPTEPIEVYSPHTKVIQMNLSNRG